MTIVRAGIKNNVVPGFASALVNHRVHPSDSIDDVVANDNEIIDDSRVKVSLNPGSFSASKVSKYEANHPPFRIIANSAYEIFPNAHCTPGIMIVSIIAHKKKIF